MGFSSDFNKALKQRGYSIPSKKEVEQGATAVRAPASKPTQQLYQPTPLTPRNSRLMDLAMETVTPRRDNHDVLHSVVPATEANPNPAADIYPAIKLGAMYAPDPDKSAWANGWDYVGQQQREVGDAMRNTRLANTLKGSATTSGAGYVNAAGTLIDFAHRNAAFNVDPNEWAKYYEEAQEAPELGVVTDLYGKADTLQERGAQNIEEAKEGLGWLGQRLVDAGVSGTQMLGDAVANAIIPGAGLTAMGTRAFGSAAMDARHEGASVNQQMLYGLANAAVEVLSEKIGDIPGVYGGGWLDDAAKSVVSKWTSNPTLYRAAMAGASALGESLEEFAAGIIEPGLRSIYNGKSIPQNYTAEDWREMGEAMFVGAMLGGLGGMSPSVQAPRPAPVGVETAATVETADEAAGVAPETTPTVQSATQPVVQPVETPEITREMVRAVAADPVRLAELGISTKGKDGSQIRGEVRLALEAQRDAQVKAAQNAAKAQENIIKPTELGWYGMPDTAPVAQDTWYAQRTETPAVEPTAEAPSETWYGTPPSDSYGSNTWYQAAQVAEEQAQQAAASDADTVSQYVDVQTESGAFNQRMSETMKRMYIPSQDATGYIQGMTAAYNAGRDGRPMNTVIAPALNGMQLQAAYIEGQAAAKQGASAAPSQQKTDQAQQMDVDTTTEGKPAEAQKKPAARVKNPGLIRDENAQKAKLSYTGRRAMDTLAKMLGVNVRFVESIDSGVQGYYDNGEIAIALDGDDPFLTTAVHESVHRIRELSESDYNYLRDFVVKHMADERYELAGEVKEQSGYTAEEAPEEIIADGFGRMLGNEAMMKQFVAENSTAAQRIMDVFAEILDRIRQAMSGKDARSLTDAQIAVYSDLADRIDVMLKYYNDAIENVRGSEGTGNGSRKNSMSDRTILKEYSDAEKKQHADAALKHFGKTYSWNETGWLTTDGQRIDFSGKHDGAPGGYRTVDHRDISDALGLDYGGDDYSGALFQFMSEGNIRISPENGGINVMIEPTEQQYARLKEFIERNRGEVMFDVDNADGVPVKSMEWSRGTRSDKVISDIKNYFAGGYESPFAQFRYSKSDRDSIEAVMAKRDADYAATVESGDMEAAQRMVDEAAKAAGYDTPKLYHGTRAFGFTQFDTNKSDDGISLFATDNPQTAETYSGKTGRTKIKDRSNFDASSLHGDELISKARENNKRYKDYKLMSEKDREQIREEARRSIGWSIRRAQEFVRDHNGAFDTDKAFIMDRLISALYHLRDSETDGDISSAWTEWEDAIWDLKGMDDSIAIEFLDDVDSRGLFQSKNELDDMTYLGDIYADWYPGGPDYVFDNQLQLELDAAQHQGIYELYGKPGKQLVIEANGANWNQIAPPEELLLSGPQRTRDIAVAAKAKGYDSIIFKSLRDNGGETPYNGESNVYIFFRPDALKSADPVTYDDAGNVIPLSERFNPENEDIRYSTSDRELLDEYIKAHGAIKTGENPTRDITMPKRTTPKTKMSMTVRTVAEAGATPDEFIPTIENLAANHEFDYTPYSDKNAIADADRAAATKGWQTALTDWVKDVSRGEVSKKNTALGWALYNNAVNAGDTETALLVLRNIVQHQRNAAQAVQATRILKQLNPETQLYNAERTVESLNDELKKRYGDKVPDLEIDPDLAERFLNARSKEGRDKAMKDIYRDIGRQMPTRFIDRWNAWRYLAMLGNPRTHIRNVVGNAGFAPIVAAKDLTATAIESAVSLVSGGRIERTKGNVIGRGDLIKAAWNDYANVREEALGEGKYNDSAIAKKEIQDARRIFGNTKSKAWNKTGGAALEAVRRANGTALDAEDVWFSKPHYTLALAQYCAANGITAEQISKGQGIARAREYAIREAQKATYRDTNDFSQAISRLGRGAQWSNNKVTRAISTIIEGILPFRKTPANILARGVEYSPLGLMKSLTYDLAQVKNGNITAADMIDDISAGLTGTGLLALGAYLVSQGLLRGRGGDDDKKKSFADLTGHQDYALELPDGTSITLDWLAPEALPMFVGANLAEIAKNRKDGMKLSDILSAIGNVTEPMLEMSCLQSLNNVFEAVGYAKEGDLNALTSALSSAATSYLTQALPTLLGQAERTGEDKRMTTYTDKNSFLTGDMQYTIGKASARIPVLEYNQIPYIDAWGREELTGKFISRAANNFFNPSYISKVNESDMEKELERLYDSTGENVFPQRAPKYFTVDGERKDLTAEEYVKYATEKGRASYAIVGGMTASDIYKGLEDAEKASCVKDAYTYANETARTAVGGKITDSWVEKAKGGVTRGIAPETYILMRNAVGGITGIKDANGNTIDNSKGLQIMEAIYQIPGLNDEQRRYLFQSFGVGKTVIGYNKTLVNQKLAEMRKK